MKDTNSQKTDVQKSQKSKQSDKQKSQKSKQSDKQKSQKSKQSDVQKSQKSKQSDVQNSQKSKQSDVQNSQESKQSDVQKSKPISDTKTINSIKFSYINQKSEINQKFKNDVEELKVFSDKSKSYAEKRQVFVNLLIEFILTIKRFIELLLNRTADIDLKIETFHKFLWQLKKIILIINSHNPMKVKNNAF